MVRGEGLNSWEGKSAGVGIEGVGKERTVEARWVQLRTRVVEVECIWIF